MRVKVWSGDMKQYLGEGSYDEDVEVFFIGMPSGNILSLTNAEERPSDDEVPEGGEIISMKRNPKIVLDTGKVVYGCQVWWDPIRETKTEEARP